MALPVYSKKVSKAHRTAVSANGRTATEPKGLVPVLIEAPSCGSFLCLKA